MSDAPKDLGKTSDTSRTTRAWRYALREHRKGKAAAGAEVASARKKKSKRAAYTTEVPAGTGEGSGQFQHGSRQQFSQDPQMQQQLFPQQPQQAFPQQYSMHPQQFLQQGPLQFQQLQQYGVGFSPQQLQQAAQLLQQQQFTQILSQQFFQSTQTAYGTPPPSYGSTQFSPFPSPQQHFQHQQQQTFYAQPTPHGYGVPHNSLPPDSTSQPGHSSSSTAAGPLQLTSIGHSTAQHAQEEAAHRDAAEQEGEDAQEGGNAQEEEDVPEFPPPRRAPGRGRKRYIPKLKNSLAGGPEDPSILIGFEAHVAYDIYNKDRPPMKFHIRSTMLDGWRPNLAKRWGTLVDECVFGHIKDTLHTVLDIPLMTAFIERWQSETNSFHFPCCEMTVTLHDVYQTMKL